MISVEDEGIDKSKFLNAFMIETDPEGYNSGRIYYFQAENKLECQQIVRKLTDRLLDEKKKRQTTSCINIVRHQIRIIFYSRPFQNLFALLIIGVRITKQTFFVHI